VLKGESIICISSIDWDFIWQGHQEIMSTLAANGCRVLFIENTGIRAPTWRDMPRLRKRLQSWWRSTRGFRQIRENLHVFSPCILPFPYSRLARRINRRLILRDLRRWMHVMGFGRPIIWTFLPTRLAADIIRAIDPKCSLYYCIDNFADSSPAARRILRDERAMFRLVDAVFVTSTKLYERALAESHHVHRFPFGVSFEKFEAWRSSPRKAAMPEDIARIRAPRIGYVGGVHRWIDQELLCAVADAHPEWSLVLVGPVQTDISWLTQRANVHLLGGKPHEALPSYIDGFDVATIPYRLTAYTDHVYPTKTNEYLALGKPVVSTPLREILAFNEQHEACIRTAGDAAAFARQVEAALAEGANGFRERERRIAAARENSWSARIEAMSRVIQERMAERARERERDWQRRLLAFLQTAQMRLVAAVTAVLVAYALLLHTPLVWWAAAPLKVAEVPQPSDVIVVFAGGVGESGRPGQGYEERVRYATELYRQGFAERLIFSSGYTYAFQEVSVMRLLALALGVPSEAIVLETQARNTYENVVQTSRLLRERGWRSALIVSSPYHMRRVAMVYRKAAPDLAVRLTPIPFSIFYDTRDRPGRMAEPRQIRAILHEYASLVYYRWKGYL